MKLGRQIGNTVNGKAVDGEIDLLPNELFKNNVLHALSDQCFETSIRPKKFDMATITSIPTNVGAKREFC